MGRGRVFAGIVIILIGVVFMLNTLGVASIEIGDVFANFFWPVVFILLGLTLLTGSRQVSASRLVISLVFIVLGLLVLGNHLGLFHVRTDDFWGLFWPVMIILVGVNLLFRHRRSNNWAVMGTVNRRHAQWDLKTEDYWAVMGAVHVDLRTANIPDGETVLRVTAVMGEVTIFVPEGLAVVCRGNCVLGGLNFFGREQGGFATTHEFEHGDVQTSAKVVRIECESIMGNVKVIER